MGDGRSRVGTRRREDILAAALRCFRREGFHGTGIAAICREAGMSPGHLYHYFPSKEAIVEAIVEADRARVAEIVAGLAAEPEPLDALLAALLDGDGDSLGLAIDATLAVEVLAESARNPAVAAIQARYDAAVQADLAALLGQAQARGEVDPDLDPGVGAGALLLLADGILSRRISDPAHDRAALREALRRMVGAVLGRTGRG